MTHPGSAKVIFRATIDSVGTGPFDITQVALESHDLVTVTPARGKLHFRMVNFGHIDGVDFKVGCVKRFTVQGTIDGAPIANNNVYLGSGSANPTSVPFTMERS